MNVPAVKRYDSLLWCGCVPLCRATGSRVTALIPAAPRASREGLRGSSSRSRRCGPELKGFDTALRRPGGLSAHDTLATRQHIQGEFHLCRLVHTDPASVEGRDPSIASAVEAVREKLVISRCVGIDDPLVLGARLGVLVQLHDVVHSAQARRYDLDDEHNIRCRDTGRTLLEHAIWNHNDVRVTHTRRERRDSSSPRSREPRAQPAGGLRGGG